MFQKYWLGSGIVFKVSSVNKLEKRFKLCQIILVKYETSFKISIILKPDRGRPTSFDDWSNMAIDEALSGPINMTTANYGMLLDRGAKLTASRRNVAQQQFQAPHRSTKFLLGTQLQVYCGVGEGTTPVRAVATRSI